MSDEMQRFGFRKSGNGDVTDAQMLGPLRMMSEEEVLDYLWLTPDSQVKR